MLITSDRCWFRAIYSLFRALSTSTVCRLSSYIHVPTVAKSSRLPILVSANEAPGSEASQCTAAEFYQFLQCSENSLLCSVQFRLLGRRGLYFHQERSVRRQQVVRGRQNYILISTSEREGRKRQIALPKIIYNLLRKSSQRKQDK